MQIRTSFKVALHILESKENVFDFQGYAKVFVIFRDRFNTGKFGIDTFGCVT